MKKTLDDAARPDIWAGYDPEKAREALHSLQGALRGVDIEQLKKDCASRVDRTARAGRLEMDHMVGTEFTRVERDT